MQRDTHAETERSRAAAQSAEGDRDPISDTDFPGRKCGSGFEEASHQQRKSGRFAVEP
jgi:hypothetical protein